MHQEDKVAEWNLNDQFNNFRSKICHTLYSSSKHNY